MEVKENLSYIACAWNTNETGHLRIRKDGDILEFNQTRNVSIETKVRNNGVSSHTNEQALKFEVNEGEAIVVFRAKWDKVAFNHNYMHMVPLMQGMTINDSSSIELKDCKSK